MAFYTDASGRQFAFFSDTYENGKLKYSYLTPSNLSYWQVNMDESKLYHDSMTYGEGGWYDITPIAEVEPDSQEHVSSAVYTNNVEVTGNPICVRPFADVNVVYTANDGYLFGNGAKAITNELVVSSNPTVDVLEQTVYETQNTVVTNSQGEVLGEITLSKEWVEQVEEDNPGVALGDTQENGITLLENEILGLDGATPNDIPVIAPVQSADDTSVMFKLDNVDIDDTSCAKVTYRVVPSEGEPSKSVGPGETVPMALPDTGVRYYKIEVDVGATK